MRLNRFTEKPIETVKAEDDPHGRRVAFKTREDILRLQYTKLANYFDDDLVQEWGGTFAADGELLSPEEGFAAFMADLSPLSGSWIDKRIPTMPWGPDNVAMSTKPSLELGMPYEHYISAGSGILNLNVAQQFLCVPALELLQLKQELILDRKVIEVCVRRMCRPRREWPRLSPSRSRIVRLKR